MCFRSFTPRFPPLLSPISPPLPPWAPLPLSSLLHAFTQSLSSCQWLPCPLHALWLWLSLLHPPPPLSRTLYKYPIKWIMRSAVLHALPGVRCSPWLECQFTVWYYSSLDLHIWLMRLMVYFLNSLTVSWSRFWISVELLDPVPVLLFNSCRKFYCLCHCQFAYFLWCVFQGLIKSVSIILLNAEELQGFRHNKIVFLVVLGKWLAKNLLI